MTTHLLWRQFISAINFTCFRHSTSSSSRITHEEERVQHMYSRKKPIVLNKDIDFCNLCKIEHDLSRDVILMKLNEVNNCAWFLFFEKCFHRYTSFAISVVQTVWDVLIHFWPITLAGIISFIYAPFFVASNLASTHKKKERVNSIFISHAVVSPLISLIIENIFFFWSFSLFINTF